MDTMRYVDQAGILWQETTSRTYTALRALEEEYKKLKYKTWFNLYSSCLGIWVLTVKLS